MKLRDRLRFAGHVWACLFAIIRQNKAGFEKHYIAANRIVHDGKFIFPEDEK